MESLSFSESEIPAESTVFTFSTSSDLKILVTELVDEDPVYESEPSNSDEVSEGSPARFNSPHAPITEKAIFYVKKSVLADNDVWMGGEENSTIEIPQDSIKGMGVWLATFHGQSTPFSTMAIDDIWAAIKVSVDHGFDREELQPWFSGWVRRICNEQPIKWNDVRFNRQLLFPCHFFDHAESFKDLTRHLVYNTNLSTPIKESKPIRFNRGYLTPCYFIGQLNAVREKLRTTLQCQIFAQVGLSLAQSPCGCNETAIGAYLRELNQIGIKPWGEQHILQEQHQGDHRQTRAI